MCLGGALLLAPKPVSACSCAPSDILDDYEESDAVFAAVVRHVDLDPIQGYVVEVEVLRSWKGPPTGPLTLFTAPNSAACGFAFDAGATYLVFAYRLGAGPGFGVTTCRATQAVADVAAAAAVLASATGGPGDHVLDRGPLDELGVYHVTRSDIDRANSDDWGDVLWPIPGVVPRRQSTMTSDVTLRGLSGSRRLVTLDGFRLSSPLLGDVIGAELGLLAPRTTLQATVEPGLRVATDGSGALGGVVRLTTGPQRSSASPIDGNFQLRAQSAEPAFDQDLMLGFTLGQWSFEAGGNIVFAGDLEDEPTGHSRINAFVRPSVITDAGTFTVGFVATPSQVTPYNDPLCALEVPVRGQNQLLVWSGWTSPVLGGVANQLDVRVGYLKQSQSWPEVEPDADDPETALLPTRGGEERLDRLQVLASLDSTYGGGWTQRWEADLDVGWVDEDGRNEAVDGVALLDGTRTIQASAATTLTWMASDVTTVDAAGRVLLDDADVPAADADEGGQDGFELTDVSGAANLGITHRFSELVDVRLTAAYGARPPSLRELLVQRRTELGTLLPNQNLRAEHAAGADAGVRLSLEPVTLSVIGHYTHLFDAIERRPTGLFDPGNLDDFGVPRPFLRTTNRGEARLYGVDGLASLTLDGFRLHATASWLTGEQLSQSDLLGGVPPLNGALAAVFSDTRWGVGAYARWAVEGDDTLGGRTSNGYVIPGIDAYFRWAAWGRALVTLDNLANQRYRTHGSTVAEPGFNAIVSVQLSPHRFVPRGF